MLIDCHFNCKQPLSQKSTNQQSESACYQEPNYSSKNTSASYNYRSLTIGRIALLNELSNLGGSVREVGLVASMNLGFMGFLWNLQAVKRTGGSGQYFGLKLNKSTLYLPKIIGSSQQLTQVHDIQRCQEHV